MHNGYKRGSEAYNTFEEFLTAEQEVNGATETYESAATLACDTIEEGENIIDEKNEEIADLEDRIEVLETGSNSNELLRILKNIRLYAGDAITRQEKTDGTIAKKETPVDSSEQPSKG